MDEQDEGAKIGLSVALVVVVLVVFGLIGGVVMRAMNAKHAAEPVAALADADTLVDVPLSGEIVARLLFDFDKFELHADAPEALASAMKALAAAPGKKMVIAGFHDPSGDAAHNAELAKQRAKAVRAALLAQGADAARVQLRKPEQTALGGPPEEARRVEVRLVD